MWKRILSLVLLISFCSIGFCSAFNVDSIKDEWLPKIVEWWNLLLGWVNNTAIPWIENNLGEGSKQEFQKELNEAIQDVPTTIKNVWEGIKGLFN